MTDVLLFHHALGATAGIQSFAARLRREGHDVTVPDLFDGETFTRVEEGVAHAEALGFDTILDRGVAAAAPATSPFVVIGFSLGVLPAQKLAQTHPGVRGAVLCHSAVPLSAFGEKWPSGVALEIHMGDADPWATEDLEAARELVAAADGTLHMYETSAHLVAEVGQRDHDPEIAGQMVERILAFLDVIWTG